MERMRRLRQSKAIRDMVEETRVNKKDLIYPIFVAEGENIKTPVDSMPGVYQYSIDNLDPILKEINDSKISGLLIFGVPQHKDEVGSSAYDDNGITQNAIRYIKSKYPNMIVVADVCLCEYTSHGHCGVVDGDEILGVIRYPDILSVVAEKKLDSTAEEFMDETVVTAKDNISLINAMDLLQQNNVSSLVLLNEKSDISGIVSFTVETDIT